MWKWYVSRRLNIEATNELDKNSEGDLVLALYVTQVPFRDIHFMNCGHTYCASRFFAFLSVSWLDRSAIQVTIS